jgi:hypothetical protein
MRCNKMRDLYFASRDGRLDESERMRLARHIAECPSCSLFVREMDASLNAAKGLPELSAPEGFEWTVKRRILEERTKLMRRENAMEIGGRVWASRFGLGAAAAAIVVLVAAFAMDRPGSRAPSVKEIAGQERVSGVAGQASPMGDGALVGFSDGGFYTGPRMVSGDIVTVGGGPEATREEPFRFVGSAREDSLARENAMLKKRIESLGREIVILKSMLDEQRRQRANTPSP